MDAATEAVRKLRLIIKKTGWKQHEAAERIGCTQATISRWLAKKPAWYPDRDYSAQIFKIYDEIFADDFEAQGNKREKYQPMHTGDVENLTIISGAGGGGHLSVEYDSDGVLVDPAMSDGFWSFPDSIKAGWKGLSRVKALPVVGDSMEPTIAKGSTVFIDTTHTYPNPEDIYALDTGDGLVIKRLALVPRSEKILVISDNTERYGAPYELDRQDVRVYGRVVAWFQWRG